MEKAAELDFVIKTVRQAGRIVRSYFGQVKAQSKGGLDIVTTADKESENFIRQALKSSYPDWQILSEEEGEKEISHGFCWIVDPLDGTVNFTRGDPHFGISIALTFEGKSVLGVVYAPLEHRLFFAQKGKGAYEVLQGKGDFEVVKERRIFVSKVGDFKRAVVLTDWPWDIKAREEGAKFIQHLAPLVLQIKIRGSAVLDLADLAAGRMDVYLHAGLKPWDWAAACLIVEEAGGRVTDLKGKPWNPWKPALLASNGALHQQILNLIS